MSKQKDERETLSRNPKSTVAQRDAAFELLREVSDGPDEIIKHHDKATAWLIRARQLLKLEEPTRD